MVILDCIANLLQAFWSFYLGKLHQILLHLPEVLQVLSYCWLERIVVDFDFFQVTQDEIPGGGQLSDIFDCCIEASKGDPVATKFFQQAQKLMKGKIDVLRISDHNTTGLVGADTDDTKTPWHQLVKGRGSSNKNINSGGSFGIGKAAPLACSYFHTIFYASKVDDVDSYVGVSRLLSFEAKESGFFGKEYTTTGTGFYSASDNMNAILKPFAMGSFRRKDMGIRDS